MAVVLFPGFELLDVFGPLEVFGNLPGAFEITMVAAEPGAVASAQGPRVVADAGFADLPRPDAILVPGGIGTRDAAEHEPLLAWLRAAAGSAELVLSVCTGSAVLARAGLLDGRRATSNKAFFGWVTEQGPRVTWVPRARWVEDGKFVTSSGVAAGIDMALDVVARLLGTEVADNVAAGIEYEPHRDAGWDPFATRWGLA
jgi:transcriptional regulator GlxA family with amidase domain